MKCFFLNGTENLKTSIYYFKSSNISNTHLYGVSAWISNFKRGTLNSELKNERCVA